MPTNRPHYEPSDRSAAELPRTDGVCALSDEIDLVRMRLLERVQSRRATDRFIREQATLLARLVVAQVRARTIEPQDSVARAVHAALTGPLAQLLDLTPEEEPNQVGDG